MTPGRCHCAVLDGHPGRADRVTVAEALELYREQGRIADAERVQWQLDEPDDPSAGSDGLDNR